MAGTLLASLLTLGLAAAPAPAGATESAELPPQEPGVTLRVFDAQAPLSGLCTLRAGQTPNADKRMPVIDWTSSGDFGLESNFVTHVIGNLAAPRTGGYTFRLTSDDGSRLWIDDRPVIDHDGLHGPEPKDAVVELSEGHHSLRVEHFERDGGQQVTLAWKPPNASGFAVVPTADYGGPKADEETLTAQSATLSADGRTVTLAVPGLKADRVVHVRSPRPFSSAGGESPWSTEARYTLNRLPGGTSATGEVKGVNGTCLDVDDSQTADGTRIQLWTCNGTGAQEWTVAGDGTMRVLGKCLDVSGGGSADGTKVQLWTCNGTGAQVWAPQPDGTLRNPRSGKCLDASGGTWDDGTAVHLWTCHTGPNQKWTLP
ncbi:ricin-type beta-trefoil lectin domain protein [Streptomyces roseolus]|uniref:ricin-type beta-trefoil lectin domain protein n=1 Tax=Streptomyces roseolus TaxID=67358 RepID=UPI003F4CF2A5